MNAAGVGNSRGSQKRSSMEATKKKIFFNLKIIILNKGSSKSELIASGVGTSKGSRRSGAMVATSKYFICFFK